MRMLFLQVNYLLKSALISLKFKPLIISVSDVKFCKGVVNVSNYSCIGNLCPPVCYISQCNSPLFKSGRYIGLFIRFRIWLGLFFATEWYHQKGGCNEYCRKKSFYHLLSRVILCKYITKYSTQSLTTNQNYLFAEDALYQ